MNKVIKRILEFDIEKSGVDQIEINIDNLMLSLPKKRELYNNKHKVALFYGRKFPFIFRRFDLKDKMPNVDIGKLPTYGEWLIDLKKWKILAKGYKDEVDNFLHHKGWDEGWYYKKDGIKKFL